MSAAMSSEYRYLAAGSVQNLTKPLNGGVVSGGTVARSWRTFAESLREGLLGGLLVGAQRPLRKQ